MIRIFKTEDGTIHEKQEMQPGSWIALTNPTASEIIDVADACRIDPDHLKAPLDEEERSRVQIEDNFTMIIVDVPVSFESDTYYSNSTSKGLLKQIVCY